MATISFKAKPVQPLQAYAGEPGGGSSLAAALAALNPSGTSNLGATALPGYNGAYPYGPPTAQGAGATQGYDFSSDPVFQQAQAIIARTEEEARAAAIARKTAIAEQYGDATGLRLGSSVEQIAKNNPFSVVASMKRGYEQGVNRLEDQLNKANLFYSGWRGTELGNASTAYQQNQYNARSRFQASIQDVNNQLAQSLLNSEWQRLSAMQSAYQAGLGNPSQYGGAGGAGGGGGGGGGAASPYGKVVYQGMNPGGSPFYTTQNPDGTFTTHEGLPTDPVPGLTPPSATPPPKTKAAVPPYTSPQNRGVSPGRLY